MSEKKYWDEKIETLPRAELEALQERELKEILELSYKSSAYYKEAFDAAGVKPSDFQKLSDISKFPFVNKQIERERQTKSPLLGDMITVSEDEVVFVSASSGSTGVPTLSPFTKQDFDEFQDVESRLFYAAGMRKNDRYVHALNFSLFCRRTRCYWGSKSWRAMYLGRNNSFRKTFIHFKGVSTNSNLDDTFICLVFGGNC